MLCCKGVEATWMKLQSAGTSYNIGRCIVGLETTITESTGTTKVVGGWPFCFSRYEGNPSSSLRDAALKHGQCLNVNLSSA